MSLFLLDEFVISYKIPYSITMQTAFAHGISIRYAIGY